MAKKLGIKPVAQNRKARHDFFIEESIECGIELKGTEVKSMRQGRVNLKESYARETFSIPIPCVQSAWCCIKAKFASWARRCSGRAMRWCRWTCISRMGE